MARLRAENYITIQGWMVTELGLKGNELLLYALIYGFSQDEGCYTGGLQYAQDWLGCVKNTAIATLKALVDKSLVERIETEVNNIKVVHYRSKKVTGAKIEPPVQILTRGGANFEPNNKYIFNNITPYNPPTENAEKPKRKPKLSESEAEAFIAEAKLPDELIPKVEAWIQYKAERNEGYVKSGLTALLITIKKQATAHGSAAVAEVIVESMARGWKGICWERLPDKPKPEAPKPKANEAPRPTAEWIRQYMEQQQKTRAEFEKRLHKE